MKTQQSGFTLIELVVVIVILGILAVTALPKFTDLSAEALQAAADGVAGSVESASNINYGVCKAGNAACVTVDNCSDAPTLMQGGALPTGYTAVASAIAANAVVACTVGNGTKSGTAHIAGT